jgi:triacylglycerol lipase
MPTALSPFRYIQLARYVLQRWLDLSSSPSAWKGKARALPITRPPIAARRALLVGAGAGQGVLRSSVVEDSTAQQPRPQTKSSSSAPAPSSNTSTTGPKLPHGGRPHVWDPPSSGPSRAPANEPNYPLGPDPSLPPEPREIYRLMNDQKLFMKGAIKPPREVVVLCHGESSFTLPFSLHKPGQSVERSGANMGHAGLYGFSTATPIPLFPSLKLHYWASVLEVLRDRMGVKVLVVGVKG